MTIQTSPTLEVTKIDVEEGFNARTTMELDALERLPASIATEGLIKPLVVRGRPRTGAPPWSPHRRLAAAKLAGIAEVPVTYYERERERPATLVEKREEERRVSAERAPAR